MMKYNVQQSNGETDTELNFNFEEEAAKRKEANDRFEEVLKKMKDKNKRTYLDKRLEEINEEHDLNSFVTSYYNLGVAQAMGVVMYGINEEYNNKEIRALIRDMYKEDNQLMLDIHTIANEYHEHFSKDNG